MKEISKRTGREYKPFTYYGDPEAENIIIAMGSVTDTTKEVIDYLRAKGEKVGLISVHLYRPFSHKYFFNVFPGSVKKITVLDRTKEPGAPGEPLYLDIKDAFYQKCREVLADTHLREPNSIYPPCIEAMKTVCPHKIDLFNATGKAALYQYGSVEAR